MDKDFDKWNKVKQYVHSKKKYPNASPREIWWCHFGENIGVEMNGKHESFERPALVFRVFNTEMIVVMPITSADVKSVDFYSPCTHPVTGKLSMISVTQIRLISARRLIRKVGLLSEHESELLEQKFDLLFKSKARN